MDSHTAKTNIAESENHDNIVPYLGWCNCGKNII